MRKFSEAEVLAELERRIETNGLRGFCRMSGVLDPGFVCDVRKGRKRLSENLATALGFEELDRAFVRRKAVK